MSSFIDRLKQGRLWDFPGGVFPEQFKTLSNQDGIADIALPERLYVPAKQHIGVEGKLAVEPGAQVLKGQALTFSSNPFAVPIHAPTSGEIVTITDHVSAHPSGFTEQTIVIQPDGLETWAELTPLQDYKTLAKTAVVETLCQAGITGMGGAGFPTHIKLSSSKQIDTLIINGIECEPYITSDDRLMREHAWQIRQGIDVLCHLLSPKNVIIAIEDNKPEAKKAMQVTCQDEDNFIVCEVPTKYPAGGEKQLVQLLTGKEIPQNGLPIDLGILMQNVGTCFAIADAIFAGKPLIQRVVTLTGKALRAPTNVWALLGTPTAHLLNIAQYQDHQQRQQRIIMGGPMMGFTVASDQVPVVKTTNCLLVPTDKELPLPQDEMPCIRCGACADACPAGLLPQQLYWHSKAGELEQAQAFNIADCIECGACAFVCPSSIPLVHYYRQTKADIRLAEEQKRKAEQAKERFNARQARLEREKAARDAKRAGGASRRNTVQQSSSQNNSAPAASARDPDPTTQMSKTASDKPQGSDNSSSRQASSQVAAAIARAKAKKAAAQQAASTPENSSVEQAASAPTEPNSAVKPEAREQDDKKTAVAAAIARAKAKKATAQQAASTPENSSVEQAALAPTEPNSAAKPEAREQDDKKTAVAAAIARAKAKKAAAQQAQSANNDTQQAIDTTDVSEDQHGAQAAHTSAPLVNSAVTSQPEPPLITARTVSTEPTSPLVQHSKPTVTPEDAEKAKQARIAAAIARAKARKKPASPNSSNEQSQVQTSNTALSDPVLDDAEEQRKKRVEAAIAKAKARQQARQKSDKATPKHTENRNTTGKQ